MTKVRVLIGHLAIGSFERDPKQRRRVWICRCVCGRIVRIRESDLLSGHTRSCGCKRSHRHGGHGSRTWQSWQAMRRRCNDPGYVSYPRYGGRGITVCAEWNDSRTGYAAFVKDMGERPKNKTLDRKNGDGNYTCGHCEECMMGLLGRRAWNRVDMTGVRVGKLTVLEPATTRGKAAHWKCACDCGGFTVASRVHLKGGDVTSCGCQGHGAGKPRPTYTRFRVVSEAELYRKTFRKHAASAARRGLAWDLEFDVFVDLVSRNCFYCDLQPNNEQSNDSKYNRRTIRYSGIDRANNALGYTVENCVPCCSTCNHAKCDMTMGEFLVWVRRLSENRSLQFSNCRWATRQQQEANKRFRYSQRAIQEELSEQAHWDEMEAAYLS